MKTHTSKKSVLIRSLLLLPLVIILFYSFSTKKTLEAAASSPQSPYQVKKNKSDKVDSLSKKELKQGENKTSSQSTFQDDKKLIEDWFITIDGTKYFYHRDENKVWHYYDSNRKEIKLDIVLEYKKKYSEFITLKNDGTHYIHKPQNEQALLDILFSDLGGMYFRMSRDQKNAVKRPTSPYSPYIIFVKNEKTILKKQDELTAEDKKLIPAPIPINRQAERTQNINQQGATKNELNIFNVKVKKFNAQPQEKRVIHRKDLQTLEHIYSRMTEAQKKEAQPFPGFPEPPKAPTPPKSPNKKSSQVIPPPFVKPNLEEAQQIPPAPPFKVPDPKKHSKELLNAYKTFNKKGNAYSKAINAYTQKDKGTITQLQQHYKEVMVLYEDYVDLAVNEGLIQPIRTKADGKEESLRIKEVEIGEVDQTEKEVAEKRVQEIINNQEIYDQLSTAKKIVVVEENLPRTFIGVSATPESAVQKVKKGVIQLTPTKTSSKEASQRIKEVEIEEVVENEKEVSEIRVQEIIEVIDEDQIIEVLVEENAKDIIIEVPTSSRNLSASPHRPPTPKSPLDHVVEMAKKDALFYFNGKEISSYRALELLKETNRINIETIATKNKKPVVRLST